MLRLEEQARRKIKVLEQIHVHMCVEKHLMAEGIAWPWQLKVSKAALLKPVQLGESIQNSCVYHGADFTLVIAGPPIAAGQLDIG